jgi:BolA protein
MDRIERIRAALTAAFAPEVLQIDDESARHAGHSGAARGGHYRVLIVSDRFRRQPALQRHRHIYAALGDQMQSGIHAFAIQAWTPEEAAARATTTEPGS